jgi:hypothetical protein
MVHIGHLLLLGQCNNERNDGRGVSMMAIWIRNTDSDKTE